MIVLAGSEDLTGQLIRAGRALCGVTSAQLAEESGLSVITIKRAEAAQGALSLRPGTAAAILQAFEQRGVGFIKPSDPRFGPGVILLRPADRHAGA